MPVDAPPFSDAPHAAHWPPAMARHLTVPATNLFHSVEVAAARFPDKPFIVYYDTPLTFRDFRDRAERLAAHLQHAAGVGAGDRVLLDLQNSPAWAIGYYGIFRADAVVVPVNPMNRAEELRHYVRDTGASVAIVSQELVDEFRPLLGDAASGSLRHLIVVTYADAIERQTDLRPPDFVAAPRRPLDAADRAAGLLPWHEALAESRPPRPATRGSHDLAVMPYTSGTTGHPKGCMHTHRSVMSTAVGGIVWFGRSQDSVFLSVLPFFHVTGMAGSLNGPLYAGATIVILSRWDRDAAATSIERHRVDTFQAITTMLVDFLAHPRLAEHDLSSLRVVRGGGAAMPAAVAARLVELTGLPYCEGYGMSETMAATHINPLQRPKPQCLGIPVFDVDARIVDPATLAELPPGEVGEIVVHGPQVMQGYWNHPEATAEAFVEIDGRRFLRTGDLATVDAEGYWFMVDRLKRMINASGFKVWPAEVEALLYRHPAVLEACVIAVPDAKRGETVKALVVLRDAARGSLTPDDLIAWSHAHMAAYKSPRIVEFVAALPKSGSGKVQWRALQDQERERSAAGS